jgi:hypothetical protein
MASAKNIGNLYAELSVKDKMTMGLNKAKKSLNSFSKKSSKLALSGSKYAAAGIAVTGAALIAGTKGAISMVDAIGDMSAQTGVGVAALMKLQQAYKDGGGNAEDAGKDIARMQKTIANSKLGGDNPFAEMGLSLTDLAKMSPEEQFKAIGDAIMKIENPTRRNALAMEVFGKSGSKLVTVFAGMEESATKLGKMPELAAKFAAAMDEANDIFGRLNTKKDQFFVGFASGIIGELLPNLQKVDGYDFTELGSNLGRNIAIGFRGLTDGTLLDIAGLKFTAWTLDLGVGILNMLNGLVSPIVAFIGAAFETLKNKASNAYADIKFGLFGDTEAHDKQIDSRDQQRSFQDAFNDRDMSNVPIVNKIGNEMRAEADRLYNELAKGVEGGLSEAANIGAEVAKTSEDVESPTEKTEEAKSNAEYIKSEVNSMQARGLGMGRENVASKVDEQIASLKQIVKLLTERNKMELSAVM